MNKEFIAMSLPAKPQSKTNIGLLFAPITMEIIGKKTNFKKMVTLNTLHSYISTEDYVDVYLNDLKNIDVKFDYCYEDKKHTDELLLILKKMVKNNIIEEKEENIYSCKCGRVEFIENGLCYGDGKLYSKKGNNLYCNFCNSKIICKKRKALVLKYDKVGENVNVIPSFLSKEMNYFIELFHNQDILISKKRDTGNYILVDGKKYSIDIEFIWAQLHGIYDSDKIMIASNHQVYVMFMINMLNRYFNNNNILFVLTPYMDNNTKFDNFEEKYNKLYDISKKLFLIYSLNWKKKSCSWNLGTYKKIKKLTKEEANRLYDYLCSEIKYSNFSELLKKLDIFFEKELNIDKNIKYIKKEFIH